MQRSNSHSIACCADGSDGRVEVRSRSILGEIFGENRLCVAAVEELEDHLVLRQRSGLVGEDIAYLAQVLAQTAAVAVDVPDDIIAIMERFFLWSDERRFTGLRGG